MSHYISEWCDTILCDTSLYGFQVHSQLSGLFLLEFQFQNVDNTLPAQHPAYQYQQIFLISPHKQQ